MHREVVEKFPSNETAAERTFWKRVPAFAAQHDDTTPEAIVRGVEETEFVATGIDIIRQRCSHASK